MWRRSSKTQYLGRACDVLNPSWEPEVGDLRSPWGLNTVGKDQRTVTYYGEPPVLVETDSL